jgi:hypothetical protein
MKKLLLVLAVLCGLLTAGCQDSDSSNSIESGTTQVSFISLTATGSPTTTMLILTFSRDITGFAVNDITLNPGNTGAQRGELTRSGNGIYELTLTGISASGQVSVTVNKSGFAFAPNSQSVTVITDAAASEYAAFSKLEADGSATATTSKLTLTFDKNIAGLTASDITLSPALTKGSLNNVSTGVYELTVSGISASGQVTVSVSKDGYNITPSSRNVAVNFYEPVIDIGIGNPSVKLFMNGALVQGESTVVSQGTGTYTISVDSEATYTEIIWYLNGNRIIAADGNTSVILSSNTPGIFQITVEATPAGGIKDSGSHSFVVQ